jgi:hypothetical protein
MAIEIPSSSGIRRITDKNQETNVAINPPIYPQLATVNPAKVKPGPMTQKIIRAGK